MPGPQPPAVNLSEAEQQGLDELVKAHSTPSSWPSAHASS